MCAGGRGGWRQAEIAPAGGIRDRFEHCGAIAGRVLAAGRDHRVGNASAGDCPAAGARRLSYLGRQPQSGSATSRLARQWRIGGAALQRLRMRFPSDARDTRGL